MFEAQVRKDMERALFANSIANTGITPAAISLLLIHLKKGRAKGFAANDKSDAGGSVAA